MRLVLKQRFKMSEITISDYSISILIGNAIMGGDLERTEGMVPQNLRIF